MAPFTKVILFTDIDGRARFKEEEIEFTEGEPDLRMSPLSPCVGYRLRQSPIGFDYGFHCTENPIWVIIIRGKMEIILQDGTSRVFEVGDCFYAADALPTGQSFDKNVHGHHSRQLGDEPLITLFVIE